MPKRASSSAPTLDDVLRFAAAGAASQEDIDLVEDSLQHMTRDDLLSAAKGMLGLLVNFGPKSKRAKKVTL